MKPSARNGQKSKKNGQAANFGDSVGERFGKEKPAIPGPGRPQLSPEVKAERKEAREILKDAAPAMAARIVELAIRSRDPDVAIKACKVGLDKVLPNLEEVETKNPNPYMGQHPSVLDAARKLVEGSLARFADSGSGETNGISDPQNDTPRQ